MFESLMKVLGAGLSIWEHKEKTKYIDQLISLKRRYNDEINKPLGNRSDAILDSIEYELRTLSDAFASSAAQSNVTH